MSWSTEHAAVVRAAALEAGFHLTGIAAAEPAHGEGPLESARFADWVDAGRAGEMEYLKRRNAEGRLLRESVKVAFPWAKSVVVCAMNYDMDWNLPLSIDPAVTDRGWIGRYAWSGKRQGQENGDEKEWRSEVAGLVPTDYHDELLGRLRRVEARLRDAVVGELETRCYVDTGPLIERNYAAKGGVGWIGKNTCVINQELGSWLLLGVIVTSLGVKERASSDDADGRATQGEILGGPAAADRCGSCTRCIDACPTDALVAPREMDASRCIAYLTIEKKGVIATEFREAMGRQVFGCDICQDVCPWNHRNRNQRNKNHRNRHQRHRSRGNRPAATAVSPGMEPRMELVNPPLGWLATMDAKEFNRRFERSPLERTGRKRLHRNVAIAMGNSRQAKFLPTLQRWSEGEDAVLAEAAQWAIEQIQGG